MKLLLSKGDLLLSGQALALVVAVRWHLWRTPFARLHAQWRAGVQQELDAAFARGLVPDVDAAPGAAPDAAPDTTPTRASIDEVWNCSHAVRRAAWLVPQASCLTQAMALQMMLARRGHHCAVRIGVERRAAAPETQSDGLESDGLTPKFRANPLARGSDIADGKFRAHAWVEWHGRVLIGGDVRGWKPLTIFAPSAPPISKMS